MKSVIKRLSILLIGLGCVALLSSQVYAGPLKTLVVAQAGDIAHIDSLQAGGTKNAIIQMHDWGWMRYPILRNPNGTYGIKFGTVIPNLIEAWETEEQPDGTAIHRMHIRPGMIHHSGNPIIAEDFKYIRKQGMQLASKMRFIAVQFNSFLSGNLWYYNAENANKMAKILYNELKKIHGIILTHKVETNAVFVKIPKIYHEKLRKKYFLHVLDEKTSEIRFMCSFDTTEKDVLNLVKSIREIVEEL